MSANWWHFCLVPNAPSATNQSLHSDNILCPPYLNDTYYFHECMHKEHNYVFFVENLRTIMKNWSI